MLRGKKIVQTIISQDDGIEKPLWISHRGYKKGAVENTRAAFRAAVARGFSCLETDLRLSRDGRIVLIHDPDLGLLAGDHRRVKDLTAAELAAIRLSLPDYPEYHRDRPDHSHREPADANAVLFFDEFAAEFSQCRWVLDIKPEEGDKTILALSHWAKRNNKVEAIIHNTKMLTWHPAHQALASTLFPGLQFYARQSECWRAGLAALFAMPGLGAIQAGKTYALPPTVAGLPLYRPSMVRRFHERGASLVAFLPPSRALTRRAVALGFDEILTNFDKRFD